MHRNFGFTKNPECIRSFEITVIEEYVTGAIFHISIGINERRILEIRIVQKFAGTDHNPDCAMNDEAILHWCSGAIHVDAVHGNIIDSPQGNSGTMTYSIRNNDGIPVSGQIIGLISNTFNSAVAIFN
jgi:hypothetical protein